MSNEIRVTGNVGKNPEQKTVGDKKVTELSIFCDEWKWDEPTKEYKANGGDWYEVSIWNETLGDAVFTTIRQGARIEVLGHLALNQYTDKNGEAKTALRIRADDVAHKLNRVEQIKLREKREAAVPN